MKWHPLLVAAGAALIAAAGSASAAPILDVKLVATPASPPSVGLVTITVLARAIGTSTGQGDGGISEMQVAITTIGSGNANVLAAGTGPLATKAKINWDPVVSFGFSTVNPAKTDLGSDGDADLNGAAFFDPNNFIKTDLGVAGYQTIFTTQFQFVNPAGPLDVFHATVSNAQYYDFNGSAPNFRGTFSQIITQDAILAPEPAALTLAGAAVALFARRRFRVSGR